MAKKVGLSGLRSATKRAVDKLLQNSGRGLVHSTPSLFGIRDRSLASMPRADNSRFSPRSIDHVIECAVELLDAEHMPHLVLGECAASYWLGIDIHAMLFSGSIGAKGTPHGLARVVGALVRHGYQKRWDYGSSASLECTKAPFDIEIALLGPSSQLASHQRSLVDEHLRGWLKNSKPVKIRRCRARIAQPEHVILDALWKDHYGDYGNVAELIRLRNLRWGQLYDDILQFGLHREFLDMLAVTVDNSRHG